MKLALALMLPNKYSMKNWLARIGPPDMAHARFFQSQRKGNGYNSNRHLMQHLSFPCVVVLLSWMWCISNLDVASRAPRDEGRGWSLSPFRFQCSETTLKEPHENSLTSSSLSKKILWFVGVPTSLKKYNNIRQKSHQTRFWGMVYAKFLNIPGGWSCRENKIDSGTLRPDPPTLVCDLKNHSRLFKPQKVNFICWSYKTPHHHHLLNCLAS